MTGLDHKRADLETREKFAATKEMTQGILDSIKNSAGDCVGGCALISTCNRTELYVTVLDGCLYEPSKMLCNALERDYNEFARYFTERTEERAMEHLCRVASGLDSRITGDDQIITQVREALEFSREQNCTDCYIETVFKLAVTAAKAIKTKVLLKSHITDSVPGKAVEKLKTIIPLADSSAVVIGNGKIGRLVSQLLIHENANVTVTLREFKKKGVVQIPERAETVKFGDRYKAIEQADIVVSATTSPHFTLFRNDFDGLGRLPKIAVDLAVPRDIEPSIGEIPGLTLLTIDDISGESRVLPPEGVSMINDIIAEHIDNYYRWLSFKTGALVKGGSG
jgi:glutamyl-tRNA reductase